MMDMMTIILVFLLKSSRRRRRAITFDTNLQVPQSVTELKPKRRSPVTITKKVMLVEGDAVAPINNGRSTPRSSATARTATTSRRSSSILEKHAKQGTAGGRADRPQFEAS